MASESLILCCVSVSEWDGTVEQNGAFLGSEISEGTLSAGFSVERSFFPLTVLIMLIKQTSESRKNKCHKCQDS